MVQETDQRLAALRARLADIADSLDKIEARREALTNAGTARPSAREHATGLRTRLVEAEAELEGLRLALVNRGIIERAKGMLMVRLSLDEDAAFEYLRQASMRTNRRLVEMAEDVVRTRAGEAS
jgi:ANTAR domain